jgi:thioredoxin reductase (NADPH)
MLKEIIIIGSGPAGYTAGIYASRACLDALLIRGTTPGGQLTTTTDVENYPGFAEVIQGPWLMEQMELQAEKAGLALANDTIISLEKHGDIFLLKGDQEYQAKSVILATGAQAKWLGLPSEEKFKGYGVSSCATCDGFFYKNKDVLVIGGGNTALEEALYLSKIAKSVTLIHRRDSFRAEKILQNKVFNNEKITILWNKNLVEVVGHEKPLGVTGAIIKDAISDQIQQLEVAGIFIAIGHSPNNILVKHLVNCDSDGYVITESNSTKTSIPGLFAAGDLQDKIYRQAITAAGSGCMAALDAEKYLSSQDLLVK